MTNAPPATRAGRVAAPLIAAILLVAAAILLVGIYLILPQSGHAPALLIIGAVGVVFGVISYLLQSASRDPSLQRGVAWGFYAFGFAVLFLTLGLNPASYLNLTDQVIGLVITLVVLAGSVAAIAWRYRTVAARAPLEAQREAWRSSTPASAFEYSTAHSPSAPATAPAPSTPPSSQQPPAGGH